VPTVLASSSPRVGSLDTASLRWSRLGRSAGHDPRPDLLDLLVLDLFVEEPAALTRQNVRRIRPVPPGRPSSRERREEDR
jgi:hypothetical protein